MRIFSGTVARVLALVAVLTLAGIAPAAAVSSKTYEKQVISATNEFRKSHHLKSVKSQSCVDRWAEDQAQWMASTGTFAHREGRMRQILRDCKLTMVSENIALNFRSGTKAVTGWKNSAGHRKNMMASKMRYIGVGAVKGSDGQWYVSQVFGSRK